MTETSLLAELRMMRQAFLNHFLLVVASIVTLGSVLVFIIDLNRLTLQGRFAFILFALLLLWIVTLVKSLPTNIRVGGGGIAIIGLVTVIANVQSLGLLSFSSITLFVIGLLVTIFLNVRADIVAYCVGCFLLICLGWLTFIGVIQPQDALINSFRLDILISYTIIAVISWVALDGLIKQIQEVVARQQMFSQKLYEERQLLELRVTERTEALALTAQVSHSLNSILDRNQLLQEIVTQIQGAFNYYHVHIYILDGAQQNLLVAGGTGETGKALLLGKHKLAAGQGLVGRAAIMNIPILVADVGQDSYWVPNPLLPETKAEIAVPIAIGDEVIGVLDVQHNIVNGLSERDIDLLETIANQIAVALRNATLYEQVQYRAHRQTVINNIGQKIQLSPNIEFALKAVARELSESLNANYASATVNDPQVLMSNRSKVNE